MSKSKAAASAERPPAKERTINPVVNTAAPEGYEQVNLDLVGFYTLMTAIHLIPLNIKLIDSDIDDRKTSVLVTCKLVDACVVKDSEGNDVEAKPGDLVGVWGRPGLFAMSKYAGSKLFIKPDGEKDIGKPDMMKMFKVLAEPGSVQRQIPVEDDYREKSLRTECKWLPKSYNSSAPTRTGKPRPSNLSDNLGYAGDEGEDF